MLRKYLSAAVLPLAAALIATAGQSQEMPRSVAESVTISFYNYNLASAGLGARATNEMLDKFEREHPTINVKRVAVPPAEVIARIQADIVAGRRPDVAQMVFADFDFIVNNLGARALEHVVPAGELAAHFEGMVPNGLELGRLDGKTYGLAYTFSTPVLFYNADLFAKAGLDPDQPPSTWEEVKEAAVQINKRTGKVGLLTGMFGPSAYDWLFQAVILSNGGRVLSEDRKTLMFGEPEAVEALATLREIHQAGGMPNLPTEAAVETMGSGNAGMYLQTSARQGSLRSASKGKFDLRAAPMPAFGDKPTKPTNSGSALMILSDDPLKQRAAWELMKFLTSDYAYTIITSKIGYLPLRMNAVEDPQYLAGWIKENPLTKPNLEQLTRISQWVPLPGPNYRQIMQIMMNAAEASVFGDVDPAKAMPAAQERAQALMPR